MWFVCLYRFSDIASVSASRSSTLQITLRSAGPPIQFYTQRAALIRDLLHRFANEAEKVNNYFKIKLELNYVKSCEIGYGYTVEMLLLVARARSRSEVYTLRGLGGGETVVREEGAC